MEPVFISVRINKWERSTTLVLHRSPAHGTRVMRSNWPIRSTNSWQVQKHQPVKGNIKAIIVPHAGHRYSGGVAAHAYNVVREQRPKTIAVISPMHQYHPAWLLTSAHEAYVTPLGQVSVNRDLVRQLSQALMTMHGDGLTPIARDQEHAIEIQLPFLQRIYPDGFNLLPVMLRDQSAETARVLADALVQVLPEGSLLVASSDLSHFYTENDALQLDGAILKAIQRLFS